MIEISLNNIKKSFGFKNVLDGFNLEANTGERIALIGNNGCGKSTVFNIIAGIENISDGVVSIRKGATIGFLNQIVPNTENNITVENMFYDCFQEIFSVEKRMRTLENKMALGENLDSIYKEYSRLQDKFMDMGGYVIEEKIGKIRNVFKINDDVFYNNFNNLSGGEKTIVSLALLILKEPSILLLDEPTNHIDIDTLEWFENFLINYKGTVIISSHDRYFLDKVVTRTVLIDKGREEVFHGNYSYYLKENERRTLAEFEDFKNQQKQIAAMEAAIKRLKEWGRISDNPMFFRRAKAIESRLDRIDKLDRPDSKKKLPLDFEVNNRSGKDVINIKNLTLEIGNKLLLDDVDLNIKYGEHVCLMGKNGTGKSTLIKEIITNNNDNIRLGSNVNIGYIPQEIRFEDDNMTILDLARKRFSGDETHLRMSLAKFMFYDDKVYKRIGKLSGGEKVRLKLFILIQEKANLLILDEPTNHIDIDTKEVLEEALLDYKGTILFISHDRYFINKVAQKIVYIEDKKLVEYLGNYDYYKSKL